MVNVQQSSHDTAGIDALGLGTSGVVMTNLVELLKRFHDELCNVTRVRLPTEAA
jgi:hypothetical protein